MFNPFTIFVSPILNVLVLFYTLFLAVKLPWAFGFAIVALTVFVRLILNPLFHKQLYTAKKMQELKPHLDRLNKKHKNDKARLQQEQMKLYKQAGINPASGCLFMIIQMPVFFSLYNVLSLFLLNGQNGKAMEEINKMLYFSFIKIQHKIDPNFLGFNLALTPQKAGEWHYYLIPAITGILQYYQVKVSQPPSAKASEGKPSSVKSTESVKEDKKPSTSDEFQKAMSTQMKFIFPIFIAWFSFTLPVGLSLYWNIFSILSIMQYRKLNLKS